MAVKLLLVDDEEPILAGMRQYFTRLGYDVDCASDLKQAHALLRDNAYTVVISDLRLSPQNPLEGMQLVPYVRQFNPKAALVLLTAYDSSEIESEARQQGISVLHKPKPLSELAQVVYGLAPSTVETRAAGISHAATLLPREPSARRPLTKREIQVSQLVAKGYRNRVIAGQLAISPQGVKNYLRRIFYKLRLANRVELALYMERHHGNSPDFDVTRQESVSTIVDSDHRDEHGSRSES